MEQPGVTSHSSSLVEKYGLLTHALGHGDACEKVTSWKRATVAL